MQVLRVALRLHRDVVRELLDDVADPGHGRLVVVCDNESIVKTFKITGLDGVFTLVRSLDDALDGDAVGAGS